VKYSSVLFGFTLSMLICGINPIAAQVAPKQDLHIYFPFNSSQIETKQSEYLSHFAAFIKKSKTDYKITIAGYCDVVGNDPYNDKLSILRAEAIKQELVKLGVNPPNIVTIKGWGKRKPSNDNKTDAERQANRRVDISLVLLNKGTSKNGLEQLNSDSVKEGTHLILKDLQFYGGTHRLLPRSLPLLDTLVKILKLHPTLKISIQGHVCCTLNGDDGEDLETHTADLSWNRAKEVYNYLIKNQINFRRLNYLGLGGKNHLIDPEITEENRTLNRRVEIVVVER